MNMKRLLITTLVVILGSTSINVFAESYLENADTHFFRGWVCDPNDPSFSGGIHVWRDDGVFLGGLPANQTREKAVGDRCDGYRNHGFLAHITYSNAYLDNRYHNVHLYFIKRNPNQHFEITGSPVRVFFSSSPPASTVGGCLQGNPGGYQNKRFALTYSVPDYRCGVDNSTTLGLYHRFLEWTYLPNLEVGSTLNMCPGTPYPFSDWRQYSSSVLTSDCMRHNGRAWVRDFANPMRKIQ